MREDTFIALLLAVSGAAGTLMVILLSIILHELRKLREDVGGCVQDRYCKVMMAAHERRIEVLEKNERD